MLYVPVLVATCASAGQCSLTTAIILLPLLPLCLSHADDHLLMQVDALSLILDNNQLVGSLPEAWGNFTSVCPLIGLTRHCCCRCMYSLKMDDTPIYQHQPYMCWAASCGWPLDMHVVQLCASVSHSAYRLHSSFCTSMCKCRGSIWQPNSQAYELSFLAVLQLRQLKIHHNNLTGTLPDAWGNLTQASIQLHCICACGDVC